MLQQGIHKNSHDWGYTRILACQVWSFLHGEAHKYFSLNRKLFKDNVGALTASESQIHSLFWMPS